MSSLFIAGNGFDIAHGIPTKYSEFRSFVIQNYPEALELRDEVVYLEDFENIDPYEFAAEILLNTMDKAAGEDWNNFEDALAYINFDNKFPLANHKENETDEEDQRLMLQYLLYMDVLTSGFINCSRIWQEFFKLWIGEVQITIDQGKYRPKDSLLKLFSDQEMQFFSFNYTKTLQKLYAVKKVIHIHNRVGQKLIFGHDKSDDIGLYQGMGCEDGLIIGSSSLDDMVLSFKKDTVSPMKKYASFFNGLSSSVDKVYSYGFSYGKVDSVYIKEIISRISENATWFFTEHEASNHEAIRIKRSNYEDMALRELLGHLKGNLTASLLLKLLFFAEKM